MRSHCSINSLLYVIILVCGQTEKTQRKHGACTFFSVLSITSFSKRSLIVLSLIGADCVHKNQRFAPPMALLFCNIYQSLNSKSRRLLEHLGVTELAYFRLQGITFHILIRKLIIQPNKIPNY